MKDHLKWATENDSNHALGYIQIAVAIALFLVSWFIWDSAMEVSKDTFGLAVRIVVSMVIALVGAWLTVKAFRGK